MKPYKAIAQIKRRTIEPRSVTLSKFNGGLHEEFSKLALPPNVAVKCTNFVHNPDNSISLRYTEAQRAVNSVYASQILKRVAYNNQIITIFVDGTIARTDGDSEPVVIWNNTIAAALPGSPSGWSTGLTRVNTTTFDGSMLLFNGVNKPLIMTNAFVVSYLLDPATGTNIYTPIASHVINVNRFVVCTSTSGTNFTLLASSEGQSGVWPGDAAPNTAISFKIGSYITRDARVIRGLANLNDHLVVFFDRCILVFRLGVFEDGEHKPQIVEVISDIGLRSAFVNVDQTIVVLSSKGVFKLYQDSFTGRFKVQELSTPIKNQMTMAIANSDINTPVVMYVDPAESRLIIQIKQVNGSFETFQMTYEEGVKRVSWARIAGMNYDGVVVNNNVVEFFTNKTLYSGGTVVSPRYFWNDPDDVNFTLEVFVDRLREDANENLTPALTMQFYGDKNLEYTTPLSPGATQLVLRKQMPIRFPVKFKLIKIRISTGTATAPLHPFEYETGWLDFGSRTKTKQLKYIMVDANNDSSLTIEALTFGFIPLTVAR